MRCLAKFFLLISFGTVVLWAAAQRAEAELLIAVDKSSQRLSVVVDGAQRFTWPISTGVAGGPPSGTFSPERLERMWYSRAYDWSPMPHAIFFYKGFAIHGTGYVSRLGRPASHGCVRLRPDHAATLFALVQNYGSNRTRIEISGSAHAMDRSSPHGMAQAATMNSYATAPGYLRSR